MILVTAWNLVPGTGVEAVSIPPHPTTQRRFQVLGEAVAGETQGEGF